VIVLLALFAHQGGWDEILLVLGPILIIVGLLRLAKNRVERETDETPDPTD
jgi:hypothetical protein